MDKLQLSGLLSTYGNVLTDKQREALTMYCDCDCSLGEIASEVGISRQGVRDAIVNGEKSLQNLENKLGFAQFIKQLTCALESNDGEQVRQVCLNFISKE